MDRTDFTVVVNHEEQYSIWPAYKPLPKGWRDVGVIGSQDECLRHISEVWKDMRPLSVRNPGADETNRSEGKQSSD